MTTARPHAPPQTSDMESFLFGRARAGMKLGLERMERALGELGHPERAAPVLHVAGTNGKGSTCAFLERMLRASGRRTALYTSPHLEAFAERFRVDFEPLPDAMLEATFAGLRGRVPWAFGDLPEGLTFFELVTLLGFTALAQAKTDVAVIEVGLGGRLDATNVVWPLVTCVTPIGLDHMEFLGPDLASIAAEKAGIFKRGVPAVSARQPAEAMQVIERAARDAGAPLEVEGREFRFEQAGPTLTWRSPARTLEGLTLGLAGPHQRTNAAVALRALELSGLPVGDEAIRTGLAQAFWPGRFEQVAAGPDTFLDGAHNGHAAAALAKTMQESRPGARWRLVLGMLGDKDVGPVLAALLPLCAHVHATRPPGPRALEALQLARMVVSRGAWTSLHPEPVEALEAARAMTRPGEPVLVCGSLHLVGAVRAALAGRSTSGPSELLKPPS